MFREVARKNKIIPMEDCIHLLKTEKRGVLSVLGDDDYPYCMPMNHWYNEEDGNTVEKQVIGWMHYATMIRCHSVCMIVDTATKEIGRSM